MVDWDDDQDYREGWCDTKERAEKPHRVFTFKEAGVARFNDVVDDGYDEAEHNA